MPCTVARSEAMQQQQLPQQSSKQNELVRPNNRQNTPNSNKPSSILCTYSDLRQTFGKTGLLMIPVLLVSFSWTLFLVLLNECPNETANFLMNTTHFNHGEFWHFEVTDSRILTASCFCFSLLAFGYLYLLGRMCTPYTPPLREPGPYLRMLDIAGIISRCLSMQKEWEDLVNFDGKYRKFVNLMLEIPEVLLQTLSLLTYMNHGLQDALLYIYAGLMCFNCFICFHHVQFAWKKTALQEMVIDALLDMVFSVVFPATILLYSIYDFRYDARVVPIPQPLFPPKTYERRAILYADPEPIGVFSLVLQSLRILTATEFAIQVGLNAMTCLRWHRLIVSLKKLNSFQNTNYHFPKERICSNSIHPLPQELRGATASSSSSSFSKSKKSSKSSPQSNPKAHQNPKRKRMISRHVGLGFLVYGTFVLLYTIVVVPSSRFKSNKNYQEAYAVSCSDECIAVDIST